jgi:hypothetical protein
MSGGKWFNSLMVVIVALITPVLVWFLLLSMAHSKVQSFDPAADIQDLVSHPRNFSHSDQESPWTLLVGKDGVWSVQAKDGSLSPLENWQPVGSHPVLLLQAQGPTLALHLHRFLQEKGLSDKVILLSDSDGLLKDLRFHDPNLTMSCGQAYVIRFHALKRLGLEGLMTIDMSAVYLDPKLFSEELKELSDYFNDHHVAVFVGPITTENLPAMDALEKKANLLLE